MIKYIDADKLPNIYTATHQELVLALEEIPAADVQEVRHGRWEAIDKGHFFYDWKCSKCGGSGRADYLFCPNCGSRMDLGEETK